MKTKAVRIYGKDDLRLEEFELPPIKEDEILARVITDSLCLSSYKATMAGPEHKRVPDNISENPTMLGHEFCGKIVEVGKKWKNQFKPGDKFAIQPSLSEITMNAAGYSFPYLGGNATHVIIPDIYLSNGRILPYHASSYYKGSLGEPYSCVAGTFKAHYHTRNGSYVHEMGIKKGGKMAMMASAGPMGLAALDYILHCDRRPSLIVLTDVSEERLDRLACLITPEHAKEQGVELVYHNPVHSEDSEGELRALSGGAGYDDILVAAPVRPLVEQADRLLAFDGCLNFFAGPTDKNFKAEFNFYNAHYNNTHLVATNGGNVDDLKESIEMIEQGKIRPQYLVTHVGGLDAVIEATRDLPNIPGGKKLIYTNISMPLTALDELEEKGKNDPFFAGLAKIVQNSKGLWSDDAEQYVMENGKAID